LVALETGGSTVGIYLGILGRPNVGRDAAVINANYTAPTGLIPGRNSIVIESPSNNPYYNFIAVRERDNPADGTPPQPRVALSTLCMSISGMRMFPEPVFYRGRHGQESEEGKKTAKAVSKKVFKPECRAGSVVQILDDDPSWEACVPLLKRPTIAI
jgi:hypothetical protein